MQDKVNNEVANQEIEGWLDYKKVGTQKRETYKDQTDIMVAEIMEGNAIITEDFQIVQTLKFPVGSETKVEKLTYKPRLNDDMLKTYITGVKPNDLEGRMNAYVAALTDTAKAVIAKLDSEDKRLAQAIVVFFI